MPPEETQTNGKGLLELEYATLRKEIETSRDRQFKIAVGALIVIPAIELLSKVVTAYLENENIKPLLLTVLGLLPMVVLSLYVLYFSEWDAINRCAHYIKNHIEVSSPTPGWETWLETNANRSHEILQVSAVYALYGFLYIGSVAAVAMRLHSEHTLGLTMWGPATVFFFYAIIGAVTVFTVHNFVKPLQTRKESRKAYHTAA